MPSWVGAKPLEFQQRIGCVVWNGSDYSAATQSEETSKKKILIYVFSGLCQCLEHHRHSVSGKRSGVGESEEHRDPRFLSPLLAWVPPLPSPPSKSSEVFIPAQMPLPPWNLSSCQGCCCFASYWDSPWYSWPRSSFTPAASWETHSSGLTAAGCRGQSSHGGKLSFSEALYENPPGRL